MYSTAHTVKRSMIFPSPAWMSLTKLSLAVIIKLFLARDSLVSDIPAGDRKNDNPFFTVQDIMNLLVRVERCDSELLVPTSEEQSAPPALIITQSAEC
jgi:hypothetical protein